MLHWTCCHGDSYYGKYTCLQKHWKVDQSTLTSWTASPFVFWVCLFTAINCCAITTTCRIIPRNCSETWSPDSTTPYKESVACLWDVSVLTVWTSTSQDCRSNLYQWSNVKSVPEKWIKFRIFSLSYTKKVKNLIHLGWVRLIVSLSSMSVLTLTVWAGFFNVTVQQWLICKKDHFLHYLAWQMFFENYY